jgi:small ligand-binding sensory domain FIST
MKWVSALSQSRSVDNALRECLMGIKKKLGNVKPHFLALFVSPHFEKEYRKIHSAILSQFPETSLMGCSGGGIIGESKEVENHPAISLAAALLPNVKMRCFHVEHEDLPDLDSSPKNWEKLIGVDPQTDPQFILLADPFSIAVENFIVGLDYAYPKAVKTGGLASSASGPGKNALFLDDKLYRSGLIGMAFSGNIVMDALVAQGCRAIGKKLQVTACDQNILLGLDGQAPLSVFQNIFQELDERDQQLAHHSLFLGISISSSQSHLMPGNFLIRNIIGSDPKKGILVVGALLRVGQTVQFHLRDEQTSHDDLYAVLRQYKSKISLPLFGDSSSRGVFLFSCLGRGAYLYKHPNHDSDLFREILGSWPISGFFCNGEIGPVGETTFLHGYTSCFGILRPKN